MVGTIFAIEQQEQQEHEKHEIKEIMLDRGSDICPDGLAGINDPDCPVNSTSQVMTEFLAGINYTCINGRFTLYPLNGKKPTMPHTYSNWIPLGRRSLRSDYPILVRDVIFNLNFGCASRNHFEPVIESTDVVAFDKKPKFQANLNDFELSPKWNEFVLARTYAYFNKSHQFLINSYAWQPIKHPECKHGCAFKFEHETVDYGDHFDHMLRVLVTPTGGSDSSSQNNSNSSNNLINTEDKGSVASRITSLLFW